MAYLRYSLFILATIVLSLPAQARDCGPDKFASVVDDTGAKLRRSNEVSEREMRGQFEKLAKLKGWPTDSATERGFQLLQDERTRTLDQQASELLIRLDLLSDTDDKPATCARLDELELAAAQLIEITSAKRAHLRAKLAVALRPQLTRDASGSSSARSSGPATVQSRESTTSLRTGQFPKGAAPGATADNQRAQPSAPQPKPSRWSTTTTATPLPADDAMAALPPLVTQPEALVFSSDEIRHAGRDIFGSISSELAAVIKFAFDSYGKPNGYVLGTEGGAAFFAGLRYGHGELVTKQFGKNKIYWQGPSIGTDFGITDSRVLMLVYNLDDPKQIYERFVGVEGAAYLVGGVGITFHKQGRLVLAPIRTGLGVRLGANVGYLKITPSRRLNPF